jgi:hypothetical protein
VVSVRSNSNLHVGFIPTSSSTPPCWSPSHGPRKPTVHRLIDVGPHMAPRVGWLPYPHWASACGIDNAEGDPTMVTGLSRYLRSSLGKIPNHTCICSSST